MIFDKIIIAGLILISLFFLACAAREAPLPAVVEPVSSQIKEEAKAPIKEGWEVEWNRALRAAQKEGMVTVYSGPGIGAVLKLQATGLIKKRFGLNLDIFSAPAAQNLAKIRMERKAGLYVPDIITVGTANIIQMKPMGLVDSIEPLLILPEVLDTKAWFGEELPWKDKERKVLVWGGFSSSDIAVNANIVQLGEIKSYYDLLNTKWKGKISIQAPVGGGSGFTGFTFVIYNKIVDLDFFHQLIKQQELMVTEDWRLQNLWLAQEKKPIALWPASSMLYQYIDTGVPISPVFPKEGIRLSGGGTATGLMNKAPHPNAARIFLNWYLSREGQLIAQNGVGKQSLRVDIPTDKLDPQTIRRPGYKYLPDPSEMEEFVLKEYERYSAMAKEVFGPVMR